MSEILLGGVAVQRWLTTGWVGTTNLWCVDGFSTQSTVGRSTQILDGPTRNKPRLRNFDWLLNRMTAAMTNENDVIS